MGRAGVVLGWGTVSDVPWIEAATLGREDAHATWALAARMRLEELAAQYHATTTHGELADWVQQRSRIRTRQQPRHWLGDVLYRTMTENQERREPFLAALVVDPTGHVGSGYAGRVQFLRGGAAPVDADGHAATERLECYRAFGAALPEGGGVPGPVPQAVAPRGSAGNRPADAGTGQRRSAPRSAPRGGRVAKTDVVPKICDRCFMALPASGQCDTCD